MCHKHARWEAGHALCHLATSMSVILPVAWTFMLPALLFTLASAAPLQFGILQVRGTLLTASQCATYDDTKRMWMQTTGWRDGLGTHVGVSMITGARLLHTAQAFLICMTQFT